MASSLAHSLTSFSANRFRLVVRKNFELSLSALSVLIVSLSSGFVRFVQLFNFQRALPSRDNFYILPRRRFFVNTFFPFLFANLSKFVFLWCLLLTTSLSYHLPPPFVNTFFHLFSLFSPSKLHPHTKRESPAIRRFS